MLEKIPQVTPQIAEQATEVLKEKIERILSEDLRFPLYKHLYKLIQALDYEEIKVEYDDKLAQWAYSEPFAEGRVQLGFHRLLAEIRGLVKTKDNGNGQVRPLVMINLKVGNGNPGKP